MLRIKSSAAALAAFTFLAITPAFAAQTVNVSLEGEGGSAMSIKLDQNKIKAGSVEFDVKNGAMSEAHEVILVRLNSANQALPFDKAKNRIDERKIKPLGEVADLAPGKSGKLTATLKPGAYALLCNIKGHYHAGMMAHLTVTQ